MPAIVALLVGLLAASAQAYKSKDGYIDLNVGDSIRVTTKSSSSGWLNFYIGDNKTHGDITLYGAAPDGPLWYSTISGCPKIWSDCTGTQKDEPEGKVPLPDGVYTFDVARRPGEMAVWLRDRPAHTATIPVVDTEDGRGRLRVTAALVGYQEVEFEVLERNSAASSTPSQEKEVSKVE